MRKKFDSKQRDTQAAQQSSVHQCVLRRSNAKQQSFQGLKSEKEEKKKKATRVEEDDEQ